MSHICFKDVLYIKGRIGWQALSKDEYLSNGDYYLVTGVDITDEHRINFSNCYYVSKERYEMDEAIQLRDGDIIVTKDGTIGKIGIIENLDKPATLNSHLFLIRNLREDILDTEFLFYILTSDYFQKFATNNTSGSNIPAFTQANIQKFEIDIPELTVQKRIAAILGNIDAKIRNNNSICSDLEAMAKQLYDYWFVQFDFPDENGKPYKSSGGKMVWNEELKREIPDGWEIKTLKETTLLYQPQTLSASSLSNNDKYLVYGANGIVGTYDNYNHENNEIAICCRGAGCGNFLMTQPFSWITGNAMVVTPNNNAISKEFLYYSLSYDKIAPFVTGSAQPQITRTNLELMKIMVPDERKMLEFEKTAVEIRKIIQNIFSQNQQLTSLRDFLLPMLMNGQVKIK